MTVKELIESMALVKAGIEEFETICRQADRLERMFSRFHRLERLHLGALQLFLMGRIDVCYDNIRMHYERMVKVLIKSGVYTRTDIPDFVDVVGVERIDNRLDGE